MYYSKHGTSDEKHFEITYYNDCVKGVTAQKQGPPPLPLKKGKCTKINS